MDTLRAFQARCLTRAAAIVHSPVTRQLVSSPLLWLLLVMMLGLPDADARVGGGSSYSGGGGGGGYSGGGGSYSGGGSSSGGGGGGGDLIVLLIWLCVEYPAIGIPLVLIIGAVFLFSHFKNPNSGDSWQSAGTPSWTPSTGAPVSVNNTRFDLHTLRDTDPNFSQFLLEDFLGNLYTRAHETRGQGFEALTVLAPYMSQKTRAKLAGRRNKKPIKNVMGVVLGSQKIISFSGASADPVRIVVEFESNYSERYINAPNAKPTGFYVRERWTISRAAGVTSRAPDKLSSLNCPNCGAPVEGSQDDQCANCDAHFNSGEFDWFVEDIQVMSEQRRGPLLTGSVPEVGTDYPSLLDKNLKGKFDALKAKDPAVDLENIRERVRMVFLEVQNAWTENDWEKARPFATDRFWLTQNYWVQAYLQQGLQNRLDGMRVTRTEPVKVDSDPFFDTFTWRIWAVSKDYTVKKASGEVVAGSKHRDRRFSEYWTFIRSTSAKGHAHADKNCPNCGAPLEINQAGHCNYCSAKIVGGQFDWVISRIEQDESYRG